ncbi:MAG: response regulator [Proteobacteria bacterium]|nr:response regulator [Pseudomonadota bacterium]
MLQDRQGFLWFATADGLNKYDGYKFTIYRNDPDDRTSLSHNYLRAIFEDANGTLWIGTNGGGLNKFNTKTETFTRYLNQADNPKSISNDFIRSILEDTDGNLWIGTYRGGLNRFDRKKETFTRYLNEANNPESLSDNKVRSVFEDTGGNIWIGTEGGGLNKFNRNSETFTRYLNQTDNPKSIGNNDVYSIFEDTDGHLWIGTEGGLNKFNPKTETFTRYISQADNPKSLSDNKVSFIFGDTSGNLWIGTEGGLNKFNRNAETFTRYLNQADNPDSISHDKIASIFEDKGGNLWFGTNGGLNIFDRMTETFTHYKNQVDNPRSLSNNNVWSILAGSKGKLWIGTDGGLNIFDRKTGTFTLHINQADNPKSLSHNTVYSISEDTEGDIWIGTQNGLNKFDRKTETFTHYLSRADNPQSLGSNYVLCTLIDRGGTIWIGTHGGGMNKFNRKNETFTHYVNEAHNPKSISINTVITILEDTTGTLWIGTDNGLNKFDRKTETFTRYLNQADNPKSLSQNIIFSIFEDTMGNIWIGTYGGGLNKFDRKNETFTCYREKDGLPNDMIYGILEDEKGCLWLSTNNGISKFDPKIKTFANYNERDGLQGNEFNGGAYYKDRAGKMYFGGTNGFNEFFPGNIQNNTYIPPVVVTDFLLFNKPVEVAKKGVVSDKYQLQKHINFTKDITLDYTDYIFAFEFSILNYRQSDENQFAYKLEGFDRDWVKTEFRHRRATYTDLPHGEYIFKVKGSNDDGFWNNEGSSIKLTILPPPWKTWWAYSLYILSVLGLVSWLIVAMRLKARRLLAARVRQIEQEKKKAEEFARVLEIKVEDRTRELKDLNEELKDVNGELKDVNEELKDVNEEFKEVNVQLVTANERLRDLDKMKSRFFANISHELRTPLTLILAPAESMLNGELGALDEEQLKQVSGIRRSTLELLKQIENLLDLSRLEEARLRLRLEPFDLKSLLIRILDFARPLAERKEIEIDLSCEENLLINGDEAKLERVFVNLLSNALKFTDTDGKISVRVHKSDERIDVAFEDSGIGIAKEDLECIFDRFGQVDPSITRRSGGSGIGLSLAKELVELHRGQLAVTSEPGMGSTFTVEIPLNLMEIIPPSLIERRVDKKDVYLQRRESDSGLGEWTNEILASPEYRFMGIDKATEQKNITKQPQKMVELKSARLLIADDNPDVLAYLHQLLRDRYEIWTAQDGKEAWELLIEHRHDLVISDVMMPEISGLELTHRIKQDARIQDTPVILLTARGETEHRIEGHIIGADQYFTKPFSPSELRAAIKSLLMGRSRHMESGARRRFAAMETLLGGMAHELHNACHQVQNAQGAIWSLVRRATGDGRGARSDPLPDLKESLDHMEGISRRALDRISTVVRSLEQYTHNQMQMPWKTINVDELVAREVDLLTIAEEKRVELKLSLDSGAFIRGSEEEIRQMVLNLVENAIHAVDPGGRVEVNTGLSSGKVRFAVSDNGCGIPADKQDQIFDPFFTTKDPGKGMGLGLALCKRTVTDLGGQIEILSKEGVGTQLNVELPAVGLDSAKPPSP